MTDWNSSDNNRVSELDSVTSAKVIQRDRSEPYHQRLGSSDTIQACLAPTTYNPGWLSVRLYTSQLHLTSPSMKTAVVSRVILFLAWCHSFSFYLPALIITHPPLQVRPVRLVHLEFELLPNTTAHSYLTQKQHGMYVRIVFRLGGYTIDIILKSNRAIQVFFLRFLTHFSTEWMVKQYMLKSKSSSNWKKWYRQLFWLQPCRKMNFAAKLTTV